MQTTILLFTAAAAAALLLLPGVTADTTWNITRRTYTDPSCPLAAFPSTTGDVEARYIPLKTCLSLGSTTTSLKVYCNSRSGASAWKVEEWLKSAVCSGEPTVQYIGNNEWVCNATSINGGSKLWKSQMIFCSGDCMRWGTSCQECKGTIGCEYYQSPSKLGSNKFCDREGLCSMKYESCDPPDRPPINPGAGCVPPPDPNGGGGGGGGGSSSGGDSPSADACASEGGDSDSCASTPSGMTFKPNKAEKGLLVGLVVGCGVAFLCSTVWCCRRRYQRYIQSLPQPLPSAVSAVVTVGSAAPSTASPHTPTHASSSSDGGTTPVAAPATAHSASTDNNTVAATDKLLPVPSAPSEAPLPAGTEMTVISFPPPQADSPDDE